MGPASPHQYDRWVQRLDTQHRAKEWLRSYFLKRADQGLEIPIPVVFSKIEGGQFYHFEFECPCCLWPDDIANKQPVDIQSLEGAFTCRYCNREWVIEGWKFILEGAQEDFHPRVLHCYQQGATSRLRLLSLNDELVPKHNGKTVPLAQKLALLLRTSGDD